jgi:hypothetical protein
MRWAAHVARLGEKKNAYRALLGKTKCLDCFEDLGVDGRKMMMMIIIIIIIIIIKYILKNKMVKQELDLSASGQG